MGLGTMLLWIGAVAGAEAQTTATAPEPKAQEPIAAQNVTLMLSPTGPLPGPLTCWFNVENQRPTPVAWTEGSAEPKRVSVSSTKATLSCDRPGTPASAREEKSWWNPWGWEPTSLKVENIGGEKGAELRLTKQDKGNDKSITTSLGLLVQIEKKPSMDEVRAWLSSPPQPGSTNRSLSSPVPPLVTDTLDIVTEIVLSRAKAGAFDVVQDQMEHWLCEDATLPTGAVVPAALMPLVGKPLLPETCRVVRGLTLPALANSAEALTSALQEDAMSAALDLARPGMTAVGYRLPFSLKLRRELLNAATRLAESKDSLKQLPVQVAAVAEASDTLLTWRANSPGEKAPEDLSRSLNALNRNLSGANDLIACEILQATSTGKPDPCDSLTEDQKNQLKGRTKQVKLLKDAWALATTVAPDGGGSSLTSRALHVAGAWSYVALLMRELGAVPGLADEKLEAQLAQLTNTMTLPGAGLRKDLEAIEARWLNDNGKGYLSRLAVFTEQTLGPATYGAITTGDWSEVHSALETSLGSQLNTDGGEEWQCAWTIATKYTTLTSSEINDALNKNPSEILNSCTLSKKEHPNLNTLIRHTTALTRTREAEDARLNAALSLLSWRAAHDLEENASAWTQADYEDTVLAIAKGMRWSVGSGILLEGTPLHELLDRMAPTLREIARNPRGFDVEDARALVGQVATVDWVETYGASSATCAAELSMAVAGLCMRDGGCDGAMVAQRLAKPSGYLTVDDKCSAILSNPLHQWPELPNLVTNATRVLAPSRSSDATEQARASLDLAFGLADLFVTERGGDQTGEVRQFLERLRRMALALVDQDLATVATTAAELLRGVLEQASRSGPPSTALQIATHQLERAMPVIATLAANARNLEQAAANPADAEALRRARKAALEDLIEASTNRENRQGDGIVSLGVPVGVLMSIVAGREESKQTGDEQTTDEDGDTPIIDEYQNLHEFPNNLALSIPLGITYQQLPWGTRPNPCWSQPTTHPKRRGHLGYMLAFSPIDLGQFLSTDTPDGEKLQWGDIVVLDGQFGALIAPTQQSASPLFIGIDGRVRPGGDAAGAWSIGLTVSYYVPLFDIN